jgi:hypothetical protein
MSDEKGAFLANLAPQLKNADAGLPGPYTPYTARPLLVAYMVEIA